MEEPKNRSEALHAWLIMLKAWQSISRYLLPSLLDEGFGESDFRVLEILLHKGADARKRYRPEGLPQARISQRRSGSSV
jgi:hypothetical protein